MRIHIFLPPASEGWKDIFSLCVSPQGGGSRCGVPQPGPGPGPDAGYPSKVQGGTHPWLGNPPSGPGQGDTPAKCRQGGTPVRVQMGQYPSQVQVQMRGCPGQVQGVPHPWQGYPPSGPGWECTPTSSRLGVHHPWPRYPRLDLDGRYPDRGVPHPGPDWGYP